MGLIESIILGLVQGQTEFLPVSSSGHLVLFQKLLGIETHNIAFDVAVHLGTLLSILTVYYGTFKSVATEVVRFPVEKKVTPGIQLMGYLILASIPTAIIGLGFKDQFEALFQNTSAVGVCFLVTGTLLFVTRNKSLDNNNLGTNDYSAVTNLNVWKALAIGVAQGLAIAPGISRSGSTISAALFLGVDRGLAALFSFVMSVPAIIGASLVELKGMSSWDPEMLKVMLAGVVTSYLSGLIGLWLVLHFVRKGRLQYFSYYLWILGVVVITFF